LKSIIKPAQKSSVKNEIKHFLRID